MQDAIRERIKEALATLALAQRRVSDPAEQRSLMEAAQILAEQADERTPVSVGRAEAPRVTEGFEPDDEPSPVPLTPLAIPLADADGPEPETLIDSMENVFGGEAPDEVLPEAPFQTNEQGPPRYKPGTVLGEGGMGVVLEAWDDRLQRHVAMKILRPELATGASLARFTDEARITGRLEHPNIIPVHDLGRRSDGAVYFTMKHIRGRSLTEVIAEARRQIGSGDLEPAAATIRLVTIVRRVCDAVAFAHAGGVMHRDLKPDNVMVGAFGEVQVMDWGLARSFRDPQGQYIRSRAADDPARTRDGAIAGTPTWMSPEQARGDQPNIGPLSDVYALGALLYAAVTCCPPVEGDTVDDVLDAVREGRIMPVGQRRATVPGMGASTAPRDLVHIVERAMSTEPSNRYDSVSALADEVQAWLEGRPLQSVSYAPQELIWKWVQRHKGTVTTATITSLVAIGVVAATLTVYVQGVTHSRDLALERAAAAYVEHGNALSEVDDARQRLQDRSIDAGSALIAADRSDLALRLLDQGALPRVEGDPWQPIDLLRWQALSRVISPIRSLDPGTDRQPVPPPSRIAISDDDGSAIVLRGDEASVFELPGGRLLQRRSLDGSDVVAVSWQGERPVAWISEGTQVHVVRLDDGEAEAPIDLGRTVQGLIPLDDGRIVAWTDEVSTLHAPDGTRQGLIMQGQLIGQPRSGLGLCGVDGMVRHLVDLQTGEVLWVPPGNQAVRAALSADGSLLVAQQPASSTLEVWETDTWTIRWTRPWAGQALVAQGVDDTLVLTGPAGAQVLDLATGATRARLATDGPLKDLVVGKGGRYAMGAGHDGVLTVWPVDGRPAGLSPRQDGEVTRALVSADGTLLLTAGTGPAVLRDAQTLEPLMQIGTMDETWVDAAFVDSAVVLIDQQGRGWRADLEGAPVSDFLEGTPDLTAFGRAGPVQIIGSQDGQIRRRDPGGLVAVAAEDGPIGRIIDTAEGVLYTVPQQHRVVWRDLTTGAATLFETGSPPLAVAVDRSARIVAVGTRDRGVLVFDRSGRSLHTLGPALAAHDVAFEGEGHRLAVASGDGTLRLFDARGGTALTELHLADHALSAVAWTDPEHLIVSQRDGTIHRLDPELPHAREVHRSELDTSPADAEAWLLRASNLTALGDVHGAAAALEQAALRKPPGSVHALRLALQTARPDLAAQLAPGAPDRDARLLLDAAKARIQAE